VDLLRQIPFAYVFRPLAISGAIDTALCFHHGADKHEGLLSGHDGHRRQLAPPGPLPAQHGNARGLLMSRDIAIIPYPI